MRSEIDLVTSVEQLLENTVIASSEQIWILFSAIGKVIKKTSRSEQKLGSIRHVTLK